MGDFIYPQLWLSEAISGFIFTLGALLTWVFMNKEGSALNSKFKKRIFAALVMLALTFTAMFAGMFVSNLHPDKAPSYSLPGEGGHGWGNPAISMGLAFAQPGHVFNEPNILVLGIFYVIFQFLGAAAALFVFVIFTWIYNSTTTDGTKLIRITKLFQMDETHPAKGFAKDGIAAMMVAFAFVGATLMSTDLPSAFPSQPFFRFTSVFAGGFAIMLVTLMMGERMVLTINPIVWFAAFILKFASHILNNRKFKFSYFLSEFASPVATMGASLVTGLIIYGIIQIPSVVHTA